MCSVGTNNIYDRHLILDIHILMSESLIFMSCKFLNKDNTHNQKFWLMNTLV